MKKISILFALFLIALNIVAVPALPTKRIITLSDGSKIETIFAGDEFYHYYEDADGNRYQEAEDGTFFKIDEQQAITTERRAARMVAREKRAANVRANATSFKGTKRGLVILASFSDLAMTYTAEDYKRYFNEVGYSENGMSGSVHDYFYACSYGDLDIQFDIVGPIKLKKSVTYYGDNDGRGNDKHPGLMVYEAVVAAEAAGTDFSKYDWNGDKKVDQVVVIYAGYGEAQSGNATDIWPHENSLSETGDYGDGGGALTYDGVTIDTYATTCELRGKSGNEIDGIGTPCHEFSHCMGLPDTYDALNNANFGMDVWDVMHYGCYNGTFGKTGTCPWEYTSYERMVCGWLKPTVLSEGCIVKDMRPLNETPEAYIIYNAANKNEYYLLENRQLQGFDVGGYGHGLVVVHVDYDKTTWNNNAVNVDANHQRMTIIPADNSLKSLQYGISYVAGDPFPGTKHKTELTDTSTPKATLYNANTDGTKLMHKPITEITENADTKTISFVFNDGPEGIESITSNAPLSPSNTYNMVGQEMHTITKGQIYIQNGRKLLR